MHMNVKNNEVLHELITYGDSNIIRWQYVSKFWNTLHESYIVWE